MTRLDAGQLRSIHDDTAMQLGKKIRKRPIYFILENIYDTYNIGGLFRLADALAVSKIYLCGQTEVPPNHKIQKASVGTYKIVPWEYKNEVSDAIKAIREMYADLKVVAIEQFKNSVPYNKAKYSLPIALIVGNETFGITKKTLDEVDQIVEIPMWGINKSLNVIVSCAIVGYHMRSILEPTEII